MRKFFKQIDLAREKIKSGPANILLSQKPFADGMYQFSMFMINYYARVRKELKIDYDSFMIIQTVVSHTLYQLKKDNSDGTNFRELEKKWEDIMYNDADIKNSRIEASLLKFSEQKKIKKNLHLTMSSICLVTGLAKETVRRKVSELTKKNLLKFSKKDGVTLGRDYSYIFQAFVPSTVMEVSKLIKSWENTGILKNLISFKI